MDNNRSGSPTGDQRPSPVAHTPGPWVVKSGHLMGRTFTIMRDIRLWNGVEADLRLIEAAPDMLEALLSTRKLVSEAAITGFNCRDGDWAERLFANQASLSAAIAKATSALPDRSEPTQSQAVR